MSDQNSQKKSQSQIAVLAGGCFWGVEDLIRKLPGVKQTTVGYTGGKTTYPTYKDITQGSTGHAESIEVEFDPSVLFYEDLLRFFFKIHDPTTMNRQGNDIGTQYRSTIFVENESQRESAIKIINEVGDSKKWPKPIVTQVVDATPFYPAEDYHQDYLLKNPGGYTCHYIRS